jgi:hypothetical protein
MSGLITSLCLSAEGSIQLSISDAEDQLTDEDIEYVSKLLDTHGRDDEIEDKFNDFFDKNYFTYIRNSNNDIFICDQDCIIANYSKREDEIYGYLSWDKVIGSDNAPQLVGDALADLLDSNTRNYIAYINDGSGTVLEQDDIRDMYVSGGIDALKYVNVIVPVYITDDLRGHYSNEYYNGERNYKVIIVQEFNIYDQFLKVQPDIQDTYPSGFSEDELSSITIVLYILGLCLLIGMVLFAVIIVYIYNKHISKLVQKKK